MICPNCKKEQATLMKIFLKDRNQERSEAVEWCGECEGEIERPFVVYIKSKIARSFIQAVHARGGFVRDTVVELMREFVQKR
jgi:hypothetical protein